MNKEKCIFDPSLKEMTDAARSAGFEITESHEKARYPKRPYVRSGYIVIPKGTPKTKMLSKISERMVAKRTKQK